MLDLREVMLQSEIDANNDVKVKFYKLEKKGDKKVRIPFDISSLSEEDKKYVQARFSILLHKTADAWNDIF